MVSLIRFAMSDRRDRARANFSESRQNRGMANKKPRGRETAWDMVLSMGAVIATGGVIMLIAWRPQEEVKQQVDYETAIASAVIAQTWPISIPKTLCSKYLFPKFSVQCFNLCWFQIKSINILNKMDKKQLISSSLIQSPPPQPSNIQRDPLCYNFLLDKSDKAIA